MTRLLCAVLFVLLAPALPAPLRAALAQDDQRFTIAVMRRDGVLLPFAAFDGRRWSAPWPSNPGSEELPITIDDVPNRWWGRGGRPSTLRLWRDGRDAGAVTLDKPAMLPIMCSARLALRTGYKSDQPVPPPIEQPFPKDGLVVSGSVGVRPVPAVTPGSADWKAAGRVLLNDFNRAEDDAQASFYGWRHPVSRSKRAVTPIQLEALYRVPMDDDGWVAYYVEAVRRYEPGPEDDGCGLVTFASGWVRLGPDNRSAVDLGARITYCDRRGAGYMLPLGLVTGDGKSFWVYQISGFDREWYVVARPTRRSVELHIEYPAGLCPQRPPRQVP